MVPLTATVTYKHTKSQVRAGQRVASVLAGADTWVS